MTNLPLNAVPRGVDPTEVGPEYSHSTFFWPEDLDGKQYDTVLCAVTALAAETIELMDDGFEYNYEIEVLEREFNEAGDYTDIGTGYFVKHICEKGVNRVTVEYRGGGK